jgi:heptosyltransferase-2
LKSIGATAALVQQAAAVVTGDTALLHMASALETPLVGIFGSTRPSDNRPLYGPQVLLYDDLVPCAPCYQRNCPLKGRQHLQCQKAVTSDQVLSALQQLSAAKSAGKENYL